MNLAGQFQALGKKQLAIEDGLAMLRGVQLELQRSRATANSWGFVAVMANVTLIPLNIIVNSFELKAASTLYQTLVQMIYEKFAKSGTRIDGHAKILLSSLKRAIVDELRRKAMTDFIPGVNILVGVAEDSLAAWQAANLVSSGSREMEMLAGNLDRQIAAANRQLMLLGMKRAEILTRLGTISRTA